MPGVQPKIVLTRTAQGWAQALGGYPTTHILKPQLPDSRSSIIFDEEYGSRIARRLGVAGFATSIEQFDGLSALVIERFDRTDGRRIHQEDFNQVLGASGNEKYQEFGGVVSLQRVAQTLLSHGSARDVRRFARMVVLAAALGNLDMHTKNIGLLHEADGEVRLADAYDVVPQAHMDNDGKFALAVDRKYRFADLTAADLRAEFAAWRLRRGDAIIADTLAELDEIVRDEAPLMGAHEGLQDEIGRFVTNLRQGRAAGHQ